MIYINKETNEQVKLLVYDGEYYLANWVKVMVISVGCVLSILCTWLIYCRKTGDPISPIVILAILVIIFIVIGIKVIQDRKPHLKIADTGIWTRTLGFVTWQEIYAAVIEVRRRGKYGTFTYLDIYLTKNKIPDDIICISLLKNYRNFEMQLNKRTQLRRKLS